MKLYNRFETLCDEECPLEGLKPQQDVSSKFGDLMIGRRSLFSSGKSNKKSTKARKVERKCTSTAAKGRNLKTNSQIQFDGTNLFDVLRKYPIYNDLVS